MRRRKTQGRIVGVLGGVVAVLSVAHAAVMGTAFTYQGRLVQNGTPVGSPTGVTCDFRFGLWNAAAAGALVPVTLPAVNPTTSTGVPVTGGVFTTTMDFGINAINGEARWLAIEVRCPAGAGTYSLLTTRQALTPAPHALALPGLYSQGGNILAAGNVGIGTAGAPPRAPLDIRGGENDGTTASLMITGSNTAQTLLLDGNEIDAKADGLFLNNNTNQNVILANGGGNVGIGTTTPGFPLSFPNTLGDKISLWGQSGAHYGFGIQNSLLQIHSGGAANDIAFGYGASASFTETMRIKGNGNVGIGNPNPVQRLDVSGNVGVEGRTIYAPGTGPLMTAGHTNTAGNEKRMWIGHSESFPTWGIQYRDLSSDGFSADSVEFVAGNTTLPSFGFLLGSRLMRGYNSSGVQTLQINAGNGTVTTKVVEITGADVAEKFPVSDVVTPGTVVEIDPDHPGQLRLARGAYNRRVAGVVSGANGLSAGAILGNLPGHEDAPAIALSGRVWVHGDTSNGPIEPGDLLTTSDTPGHAMKVTDFAKAQGAIIGKAMTPLSEETGQVLVLVSLQ